MGGGRTTASAVEIHHTSMYTIPFEIIFIHQYVDCSSKASTLLL